MLVFHLVKSISSRSSSSSSSRRRLQEVDKEPGPETFAIETIEGRGVISLISKLDYERKSLYHLRILATVSPRTLHLPLLVHAIFHASWTLCGAMCPAPGNMQTSAEARRLVFVRLARTECNLVKAVPECARMRGSLSNRGANASCAGLGRDRRRLAHPMRKRDDASLPS